MNDMTKEQAINICEYVTNFLERWKEGHVALALSLNAEREIAALEERKTALAAGWQGVKDANDKKKAEIEAEAQVIQVKMDQQKAEQKELLKQQELDAKAKEKEIEDRLATITKTVNEQIAVLNTSLTSKKEEIAKSLAELAEQKAQAEVETLAAQTKLANTKADLADFLSRIPK